MENGNEQNGRGCLVLPDGHLAGDQLDGKVVNGLYELFAVAGKKLYNPTEDRPLRQKGDGSLAVMEHDREDLGYISIQRPDYTATMIFNKKVYPTRYAAFVGSDNIFNACCNPEVGKNDIDFREKAKDLLDVGRHIEIIDEILKENEIERLASFVLRPSVTALIVPEEFGIHTWDDIEDKYQTVWRPRIYNPLRREAETRCRDRTGPPTIAAEYVHYTRAVLRSRRIGHLFAVEYSTGSTENRLGHYIKPNGNSEPIRMDMSNDGIQETAESGDSIKRAQACVVYPPISVSIQHFVRRKDVPTDFRRKTDELKAKLEEHVNAHQKSNPRAYEFKFALDRIGWDETVHVY